MAGGFASKNSQEFKSSEFAQALGGSVQSFGSKVFVGTLVASLIQLSPAFAHAEGIICQSVDQDLRIEVVFSSIDETSTKTIRSVETEAHQLKAQLMTIVDPTVSPRRQLIAKFSARDGQLTNTQGLILATVDLSHPDSNRRGERIGGTVLGSLASIMLEIDFRRRERAVYGTRFSGHVTYTKRNGEELSQDFDCVRYQDAASRELFLSDFDR